MKIKKFESFKTNEAFVRGDSPAGRSIDLRGPEGNAYSILGIAKNLCNQLKDVNPERYNWDKIYKEMTIDEDYKILVNTFEKYFGEFVTIYNADVLDESLVTESLVDDFKDLFKGKEKRRYEKDFEKTISKILNTQVGVEKKLLGYKIKIVKDGHLKINMEDGTIIDLYIDAPEKWDKDERVSYFHPKSSGSQPLKISKQVAQKAYDKLIRFGDLKTESNIDDFPHKSLINDMRFVNEDFTWNNKEGLMNGLSKQIDRIQEGDHKTFWIKLEDGMYKWEIID